MKRRTFLRAGALAAASGALAVRAQGLAPSQDMGPYIAKITGGRKPEPGGIDIQIPPIAENGNSIPTRIRVESPMTPDDYVSTVYVFAPRNPRPQVAAFHLGPQSGRAEISTRIRLAGTQKLTVLAALSGDRFRMTDTEVLVTAAACLDESA